jgi:hypothetical protein
MIMNENYYPELLKLATHAIANAPSWKGGLAYPNLIEVYIERKDDFRGYESIDRKGEVFICIKTAENSRMTDILKFNIINDTIHFGLNNSTIRYEQQLTPEFLTEVETRTIGVTYWWTDETNKQINLKYLSENELRNILIKILSNDLSIISVKAESRYSRNGKLIDPKAI